MTMRSLAQRLEAAWRRVELADAVVAAAGDARKQHGAFYTPRALATHVARAALRPHIAQALQLRAPQLIEALTVIDPAVGGGGLLLASLDCMVEAHQRASLASGRVPDAEPEVEGLAVRARLSRCLYGLDRDAHAVQATGEALALAAGPEAAPHLAVADSLLEPWPQTWPERFAVAVANPPFGSVNRLGRQHPTQRALAKRYSEIWQDKSDFAAFFVYATARVSRRGTFIVPNAVFASDKGRRFRQTLAATHDLRILDLRDRFLFPDADVTVGLLEYAEAAPADRLLVGWRAEPRADLDATLGAFSGATAPPPHVVSGPLGAPRWSIVAAPLRERWSIMDRGEPLAARYVVGKGMETGCNKAFTVDRGLVERLSLASRGRFIRRRIRGVDIAPLRLLPPSRWLIFPGDAEGLDALPELLASHLRQHEPVLRTRAAFQRGNCAWWRYTWPLHAPLYGGYRVITAYRGAEHRFVPVGPHEGLGLTDTTAIFTASRDEALALSALLMSAPVVERYTGLTKHTGAGMMEFFENQLREIPLPPRWPDLVPVFAALATALLAAPSQEAANDERRAIDGRAAAAYGVAVPQHDRRAAPVRPQGEHG